MAYTIGIVRYVLSLLFVTGVFGLPAIGAWLYSRRAYRVLKKKESKWTWPAAIGVFLGTYLVTLVAIICALAFAGFFHR